MKGKDNEMGTSMYSALGQKMVSRVGNEDRVEGALLRKAHDDLDYGTLSRECYSLSGLKGVLAADERKTVVFGGVQVQKEEDVLIALTRNGEVLTMIWRNMRMLLAAGYRQITPHKETPNAARVGEYGTITYKDAAATGGKREVRHHFTPEGADVHMLAAIKASSILTPSQLTHIVGKAAPVARVAGRETEQVAQARGRAVGGCGTNCWQSRGGASQSASDAPLPKGTSPRSCDHETWIGAIEASGNVMVNDGGARPENFVTIPRLLSVEALHWPPQMRHGTIEKRPSISAAGGRVA